ncbi:hypothetical protein [Bifidobacterium sp. ESL0745]|uniref:hypothetical protein n=1 Tax=Bifidobacterium sp. ESL0745 TaxID=2983226 RepID=UPI0023F62CEF|nr:hypothetical protein [Bifidobacterium sp. ESL0745]MDF7666122.1 hypothetical protein [Bifidobacterium sp. ESL0745]
MPSTTMRFHIGADPVLKHNNRTKKIVKYESHIDPDGYHESWRDGTLEDKYAELFGGAIEEYNKGRRKDRRLTVARYMDKVAGDRRGRANRAASKTAGREVKGKHLAYEAIVGVGNTN